MVSRHIAQLIFLLGLALVQLSAQAQDPVMDRLDVEVDRQQMYEDETLNLSINTQLPISMNLDKLFQLSDLQLPDADLESLEEDFEIIDRSQKYNVRSMNNRTIAYISWTYQLVPKRPGQLSVPELSFRGARSQAIPVEVREGQPPEADDEPRDAFIELSTDKNRVYVQEQLVLTVQLFISGNLIRGNLSDPSHPEAVIESLGNQREFARTRDGHRYRVVERRYAIFPQTPGVLSLDRIEFEGQRRDNSGQVRFLRTGKRLFDVPVKPVPDAFTGDVWLPASHLELSEEGLPQAQEIPAGQSLTRTVRATVTDLPGATLPDLPGTAVDGLRSYPEPPVRNTRQSNDGLSGSLEQTEALVGLRGGDITLPAIRIAWWDTGADRQRIAEIPRRTLRISSDGATPAAPQDSDATAVQAQAHAHASASPSEGLPWQWIAAGLGAGWLITLMAWGVVSRRRGVDHEATGIANPLRLQEDDLYDALAVAVREGQPELLQLLPRWAGSCFPGNGFHSASQVANWAGDEQLKAQLNAFQANVYSRDADATDNSGPWSPELMMQCIDALRGRARAGQDTRLAPLYPPGLNAG